MVCLHDGYLEHPKNSPYLPFLNCIGAPHTEQVFSKWIFLGLIDSRIWSSALYPKKEINLSVLPFIILQKNLFMKIL